MSTNQAEQAGRDQYAADYRREGDTLRPSPLVRSHANAYLDALMHDDAPTPVQAAAHGWMSAYDTQAHR